MGQDYGSIIGGKEPDGAEGIATVKLFESADPKEELVGCAIHLPNIKDTESFGNIVKCLKVDEETYNKVKYFIFVPWFSPHGPTESIKKIEVKLHRFRSKISGQQAGQEKELKVEDTESIREIFEKYQNDKYFVIPCDKENFQKSSFLKKWSSGFSQDSPSTLGQYGFKKETSGDKTLFKYCKFDEESELEEQGVLLLRSSADRAKESYVIGCYQKENNRFIKYPLPKDNDDDGSGEVESAHEAENGSGHGEVESEHEAENGSGHGEVESEHGVENTQKSSHEVLADGPQKDIKLDKKYEDTKSEGDQNAPQLPSEKMGSQPEEGKKQELEYEFTDHPDSRPEKLNGKHETNGALRSSAPSQDQQTAMNKDDNSGIVETFGDLSNENQKMLIAQIEAEKKALNSAIEIPPHNEMQNYEIRKQLTKLLRENKMENTIRWMKGNLPKGITGPLCDENMNVRDMSYSKRSKLTVELCVNDQWKALAEKLGLSNTDIQYFDRPCFKNPADEVLKKWETKRSSTVGDLYDILVELNMPVIADECL